MNVNNIEEIIVKSLHGNLSQEEQARLDEWLESSPENRLIFKNLSSSEWVTNEVSQFYKYNADAGWDKVEAALEKNEALSKRDHKWWRLAVAASVVSLLLLGGYKLWYQSTHLSKAEQGFAKNDLPAPKTTKAAIILSNGKTILLDSLTAGVETTQGSVSMKKNEDGQIVYTGQSRELAYNTLTNPRGSKVIDMTLSDGSKLWLNAGSSVTFPVAFAGNERKVTMTGEAYFEITHNKAMPFKVCKGGMSVTVLGTHFNVNAYDDESEIKVTLLEGSIRASIDASANAAEQSLMLKPGEQAIAVAPSTGSGGKLKVKEKVDIDAVVAWKNGKFAYSNTDLETIMRQIARWYDVDIVYKDKITDRYTVTTQSNVPASQLFKFIEMSGGVHFTIEGRKITVGR